jgi:hypothetical protein
VLKNVYCEDFLCLSGAKYALEHLCNGTPFCVKEQQILHKSKTVAENMIIVFYHSKLTFSRKPYDKCHQGFGIQDAAGP